MLALRWGWPTLSVRLVDVDERSAKAAIFGLNHTGQHPSELEEAWIVQALVREDGLSQVEAAQLLNKHKSWVCRRLALLERLGTEAQAELRLGLMSPGLARQLTRLSASGEEPVHWLLWTTEPARTKKQILAVVHAYAWRWRVEDFHLVWKQGCRVEQLQLETQPGLEKALILYAGVAVRLLRLRDLARQEPMRAVHRSPHQ